MESSSWSRKDFQPKESESQKILTTPTPGRPFAHQLWLFMPQTCVSVTLGNLSNLTLQQKMIMSIQTGDSALTCIPSHRGHSRSAASLGSSRNLHFVNATVLGLYHWNFHLLILVGTIVAPWHWLRNNEWEFSWELFHCYVMHVTEQWQCQLILHVLGSFILTWVTSQFNVRLKLFSNGYCPLDWNSNPMFYANPLVQKSIQSDMN